MEKWAAVDGWPGYEVSDAGEVRSWRKSGAGNKSFRATPRILNPKLHRGYKQVSLYVAGAKRYASVHRLVLEAFVGPCPAGMEARHVVDNDPLNCALWNLQWGSKKENGEDRVRHGTSPLGDRHWSRRRPELVKRGNEHYLRKNPEKIRRGHRINSANHKRGDQHRSRTNPELTLRGESHGMAKLAAADVLAIRQELDAGATQVALAGRYGVRQATISCIKRRQSWSHI